MRHQHFRHWRTYIFDEKDNAIFNYTFVFYNYLTSGISSNTRKAISKAKKQNSIVARIITGDIPMPDKLPDKITPGTGLEAIICANELVPLLINTPNIEELLGIL